MSPAVRTVVHLVRHGEVHNPDGVLYGRIAGYGLSERGHAMARRVAEHLGDADVGAVVASPLQRAQETATPVATAHGLSIRTDERLIESGNVFEGLTIGVGDGALSSPRHWRHLYNPLRPSWGEAYREIAARMLAAVEAARDLAPGRQVVCVSHQLPIWTVRSAAEGRRLWHDPRRRQCGLASLTSFTYDGDELVGVAYREPAADL
ncbi:histidine phosphatase family protein [Aquipuribacter sp. MA13-6]|uniref:histidine phosphatase family protein n=1 Tax=unclassified Aquipuribacter TaxID=2635084 RepID=UPI003EEF4929